VLGVMRGAERCPFSRLDGWHLAPGDVIVYFTSGPTGPAG